ncbi:hypothetical protein BE04_34535 [Sorangium cellulosum]|uniref:Uncharacterized protein n=1 Tax=Sorangium cellulosum TaxID=56 RepID=A0A150P075_SORCE|nr:hypothetical protein BE04_34535 [Sorangium cellulosum]
MPRALSLTTRLTGQGEIGCYDASMDIIGERKVVFQPAGAEHEREISLRISRPQQRPDDGWEVQIDISDPAKPWKLPPVWGTDGLGAVILGIFALSKYIEWYTQRGRLTLPEHGETVFPEWALLLEASTPPAPAQGATPVMDGETEG